MQNEYLKHIDNKSKTPWENFYIIVLMIWSLLFSIRNNTILFENFSNTIFNSIRFSILLFLLIKEITTFKKIDKNFLNGLIFVLIGVISAYFSKNTYMIDTALFIFSARDVSFSKIIKSYRNIFCLFLFSIVIMSLNGYIEDKIFFQDNRIRHSLGFRYASFAPQYMFFLTMAIVISIKKLNIGIVLFLSVINAWFYFMTNTRFPFYLSILFIISSYIFLGINKNMYFLKKILTFSFLIFGVLIFLFSFFYNSSNPFMYHLNSLLSSRLALGYNALRNFGIPMLGQRVVMLGASYFESGLNSIFDVYNYIDSGFIQSLIINGLLFTSLLIYLTISVLNKFIYSKKILIVFIFIAAHAMFDPQFFYLWFSPFILLVGKIFNTKSKKEQF